MSSFYTFEDLFGEFGDHTCFVCWDFTPEVPTSSKSGPAKEHLDRHNAVFAQQLDSFGKADAAHRKAEKSKTASWALGSTSGLLIVAMFIFPDSWTGVFIYLALGIVCGILALLASRASKRWEHAAMDHTMLGVGPWLSHGTR